MADGQQKEVVWVFNPWAQKWYRPLSALLVVIGISALAGVSFTYPDWWPQALGWGGWSLVLLLGLTFMIYVPVRYKLDTGGVTVYFLGVPNFRKWDHYRNYYVHDTGVHLTTMPKPSALDPFRGHLLQFSGNKEEVVSFIKAHLPVGKAVANP